MKKKSHKDRKLKGISKEKCNKERDFLTWQELLFRLEHYVDK